MDQRYRDTAITAIYDRGSVLERWLTIWKAVAAQQGHDDLADRLGTLLEGGNERLIPLERLWATIEQKTGHEVEAAIQAITQVVGPTRPQTRYLHYGLTSSDIVDTANEIALAEASDAIDNLRWSLVQRIAGMTVEYGATIASAYTHGQPAVPIMLRDRYKRWAEPLTPGLTYLGLCKLSGPVGTYRNIDPGIETRVADLLDLVPAGGGHSQIIRRDRLAAQADKLARAVEACGQIALDFRLAAVRGEIGEFYGGDRVGSSSMPHKTNPVTAEQVCGLVTLARGYAGMLRVPLLWEERDMSHSCVERVAVPDLLHTTAHALRQTARLLAGSVVHVDQVRRTLNNNKDRLTSAELMLAEIDRGASRADARRHARAMSR